jgi:hypothetical protein
LRQLPRGIKLIAVILSDGRRNEVTETEPKDPENVFAAMQMQGVLTKMFVERTPCVGMEKDNAPGSFDCAPRDLLNK